MVRRRVKNGKVQPPALSHFLENRTFRLVFYFPTHTIQNIVTMDLAFDTSHLANNLGGSIATSPSPMPIVPGEAPTLAAGLPASLRGHQHHQQHDQGQRLLVSGEEVEEGKGGTSAGLQQKILFDDDWYTRPRGHEASDGPTPSPDSTAALTEVEPLATTGGSIASDAPGVQLSTHQVVRAVLVGFLLFTAARGGL